MAPKDALHPKIREMRQIAKMNTVGFESGGMPKRMAGTKANNLDDYKSRFETMALGSGAATAAPSQPRSMQANAQKAAEKARQLGEAAGLGGARVPLVADAAKTMEQMLDKFVNNKLERHGLMDQAVKSAKQAKQERKAEKKKSKKDKKKKAKKAKKKKDKKKAAEEPAKEAEEEDDKEEMEAPPAPKKKVDLESSGADEELKVYVGGLPFEIDEAVFKKDFEECGEIEKIEFPKRDDGSFKGFAFVTYKSKEGVDAALKFNGDEYSGRTLKVNVAGQGKGGGKGKGKSDPELEVFLGSLPWEATEDGVREFFKECGEIASVRLPLDESGKSKGFGFVGFADKAAVDKAVEYDGAEFSGRWIKVRKASDDGGKAKGKGKDKGEGKGKDKGKGKEKGKGKDKGKGKGKDKGKGKSKSTEFAGKKQTFDSDEEDEAPAAAKADDEEEAEAPVKKGKKKVQEEANDEEEEAPPKKKSKKKVVEEEDEDDE
mmetsp:Transcript_41908/g.98249  ORF Transcript_41908/g.98249 Transcript_41908/m.98249 type:complete len:487 (-) Transcript_41908:279-1739(-)